MERNDLIALVNRIKESTYSSEEEADLDIDMLTKNTIDPYAMEYIFQKEYEDLSSEEIVDKILSYKSIQL
ncbi:hypothetical protein DR64_6599 [Paraburkholderia xenovorans LB400]|jgi:hypothetical protein|uniref:Uncharacterized protein n=1 Tax=Paraburkholderia xenovorans (strain LB400) TaxID=266265 RepID=Q13MM3_PARXL|nr:hypothetical protein [Paraburkholderia xenovorans]ABE34666.1 Hypothetical protein Bxe_B1293a [Paraburkholderia xenovorans LB400]AIP35581.1 hypothetical protein DR64_6599 [Paraburkholderia xenovorans LB400]